MAQFNNQFTINIKKSYDWLEYEDTMKACRALNGAAFKVYVYLSSFCEGEEISFSPQAIGEELGIGTSTVRNAFNELVRENYILKVKDKIYNFTGRKNCNKISLT